MNNSGKGRWRRSILVNAPLWGATEKGLPMTKLLRTAFVAAVAGTAFVTSLNGCTQADTYPGTSASAPAAQSPPPEENLVFRVESETIRTATLVSYSLDGGAHNFDNVALPWEHTIATPGRFEWTSMIATLGSSATPTTKIKCTILRGGRVIKTGEGSGAHGSCNAAYFG